jgi:hypothetical protein
VANSKCSSPVFKEAQCAKELFCKVSSCHPVKTACTPCLYPSCARSYSSFDTAFDPKPPGGASFLWLIVAEAFSSFSILTLDGDSFHYLRAILIGDAECRKGAASIGTARGNSVVAIAVMNRPVFEAFAYSARLLENIYQR